MTDQQLSTLVIFFCLFVGFRFILGKLGKWRAEKKERDYRNSLKERRLDGDRPSSQEALHDMLVVASRYTAYGSDWGAERNKIISQHVLDEELGKFGNQRVYSSVTQEIRDRLLLHTRQDAAHALLNTISIMEYIHERRKSRDELYSQLFWGTIIALAIYWWKAGFPYLEWLGGGR